MTDTGIAHADASSPKRSEELKIAEIEARIAELDDFKRKFRASKRRFRMAAFLKWQALAAARHRRSKSSERSEDLAGAPS